MGRAGMNFQQLRIITEAARHNFNLTEVAASLFMAPSGVSKNIKDLEDELSVALFERHGKRLLGPTPLGRELLTIAERILIDAGNINRLVQQFTARHEGTLVVATTHTQARYILPDVVARFRKSFPNVRLVLRQGSPRDIAELVRTGEADLGIATEGLHNIPELLALEFYTWHHTLIVPAGHPMERIQRPSLAQITAYPIITYQEGFTGSGKINDAFAKAGIVPDIVLTAFDADVIKAYVEVGLGIGLIASMAYDPIRDAGLHEVKIDGLFERNVTRIAVRRGRIIRDFDLRFMNSAILHFHRMTFATRRWARIGDVWSHRPHLSSDDCVT